MPKKRVSPNELKGRYYPLKEYLTERHGTGAYKVTIDAGFTCPNKDGTLKTETGGCAYCGPETLYPNSYDVKTPSIREQLDKGIEILEKRRRVEKFIAYFQLNTSTHAPLEELRAIYEEAVTDKRISGWAVSTRPDCVPDETLDLFNELSLRASGPNKNPLDFWLELGLQSANNSTLARIDRGHTREAFADAVVRAAGKGIKVCAHIILGLPGETEEDTFETIRFISALPVWGVKFHQLQIIKGTRLAEQYLKGSFGLLTLDEYAELVVKCLERLPGEIVIHRLVGDAPPGTQIDPWGPKKFAVLERIHERLIDKDTHQGFLIEKNNRMA